jgi:hypothetical protein
MGGLQSSNHHFNLGAIRPAPSMAALPLQSGSTRRLMNMARSPRGTIDRAVHLAPTFCTNTGDLAVGSDEVPDRYCTVDRNRTDAQDFYCRRDNFQPITVRHRLTSGRRKLNT